MITTLFAVAACSTGKKATKTDSKKVKKAEKSGQKTTADEKKQMATKKHKQDTKKSDCDCKSKDKKRKTFLKGFKQIDGFKASSATRDGAAVLVLTVNEGGTDKLTKKSEKLVEMMKKHHSKKHMKKKGKMKGHKMKDKKQKDGDCHKDKKHRAKMKAVHHASLEFKKTDGGIEIRFQPKQSDQLKHLADYANWKAKLLNSGGCKPCAKAKMKNEKKSESKKKQKM